MFVILVCLFVCLLYFLRGREKTPPVVPNLLRLVWTIGTSSLADLFKEIVKLGEHTSRLGGVTKVDVKFLSLYFITSPDDVATVLYQSAEKSFFYDLIKPYVGDQLVTANVPVFKRNRPIMDLALKIDVIQQYLPTFNTYSAKLVEDLGEKVGMECDLTDIITRNILEMVAQATMGHSTTDLITDDYAAAVDRELEVLVNRVRRPWLFFDLFFNFSEEKRQQDRALEVIWGLSDRMIKLRKEEHYKRLKNEHVEKAEFRSFLDVVIQNTVTSDSELYTDIELRNLVDNIMLAAFDTSATAIEFLMMCVGSDSRVQEKVYEELNRVIVPKGRAVTQEDLPQLVYLEAVIKETLRLYPIGPIMARRASKNMKLENYTIPAGAQLVVHIWSVNRNKQLWGADADEFIPERWLDPARIPSSPVAFGTFGPGRRYCIGKTYAMHMIKIVSAHILQSYRVTADISKLELEFVVLLKPVAGRSMRIERR
ncbi:cytochrome P450 4V2-like [Aricia agestis]|uniref:cytochrome P450 4V2-like n=1 Tax=Aricia agestis TaxID=91739 RepID=UPI001C20B3CA|nr:cytochrome P450 4V2-like [Aricia agestis]